MYSSLSVADHLRLGARLNRSWDHALANRRITQVGLDPAQKAGRLSGGQRAQLALTGGAVVKGLTVPDAWVTAVSPLRTSDGQPLSRQRFDECFYHAPSVGADGRFGDTAVCLGDLDLHVDVAYQPNHRYWLFQWIETSLYLALAGLLAGFACWRIQRRLD